MKDWAQNINSGDQPMKVIQSPQFERKIKKFNENQKSGLDEQIRRIMKNPGLGEEKKGDLKGVFVYKFRLLNIQNTDFHSKRNSHHLAQKFFPKNIGMY